ncbi:MAG: isochorismate synthase [Caryophanon sp.]|nr:isochorismate synthase [Caryophanon sp.]
MQAKWLQATTENAATAPVLYMETIEVTHLSALSFFAAGKEQFAQQRFYWQNREKTFTLVGLGHAYTMTFEGEQGRFDHVEQQWQQLTATMHKEGLTDVQPMLFGGFTFDPSNTVQSEWASFPDAFFALATYQVIEQNDRCFVTIHVVSNETVDEQTMQALRDERDALIEAAKEDATYKKPVATSYFEPHKIDYLASIDRVTSLIQQKEAQKVVIARPLALTFEQRITAEQALAQVIEEQPSSYLFGLEHEALFFFGASPERLVKVDAHKAYSSCVAGSIKRGATKAEDEALGASLLADTKNLEEHQYVVDMIAETFRQSCDNVVFPDGPQLLQIRDIQHLFTPVEGELKEHATILSLVKYLHPTPALGGVPREAAMSIIREYEPMNRGLYAAPIGWMDAEGNGEFAVAIRSAAIVNQDAYLYAGGGIVGDSKAQSEYEETLVKFRPMLRALGGKIDE